MKKFITALGVAAAMGATSVHAADFKVNDDTMFSVYGNLQYIYIDQNDANGDSKDEIADNGSTIGVEGWHDFNNGITGFFRAEWQYLADEKGPAGTEGGINTTDEIFAGVKGDFGKVQVGTWDGIFQDSISDPLNPFEATGTSEFNGTGEPGDAIAYFSPSFGGFSFEVQGEYKGDGNGTYNGRTNVTTDGDQAFQVVGKYTTDMFAIHLGYDNRGLEDDADGNIGLTGIMNLAPFTLAAKVEQIGESGSGLDDDFLALGLIGSYDYGMGQVTAAVQRVTDPDYDRDDIDNIGDINSPSDIQGSLDGRTEFLVNANYNIGSNLYVYVEGGWYDLDNDAQDYASTGAVYSF